MFKSISSLVLVLSILLLSLVACAPRTTSNRTQTGLCPEVGTVETRKPALVSIFMKVKTCQGQPVTNLSIDNFRILEDDGNISTSESQPGLFLKEQSYRPITLLLLDLSGSVVKTGALVELKEAAKRFIDTLFSSSTESYLALYWFDGSEAIFSLADFSSDKNTLLQTVDLLTETTSRDDSTNLNGAIVNGLSILGQEEERLKADAINFTLSSLVVFTDGTDRASRVSESFALEAVRSAGANTLIQTLGLGDEINRTSLAQIGRDGFELARNTDQIAAVFERAAERIKLESNSFYLLRYCSPRRAGEHQLTVQISQGRQTGAFQQNFSAQGFEAGCDPNDMSGKLLAQRTPQVTNSSQTNQTTPETDSSVTTEPQAAFDVVCIKNETPWEIFYVNKWGQDETWYETQVKPNASNVHPWPLATQISPNFYIRFDKDFSDQLDYQEYTLAKYPSDKQSCANAKTYVFRQLQGQNLIELFALN